MKLTAEDAAAIEDLRHFLESLFPQNCHVHLKVGSVSWYLGLEVWWSGEHRWSPGTQSHMTSETIVEAVPKLKRKVYKEVVARMRSADKAATSAAEKLEDARERRESAVSCYAMARPMVSEDVRTDVAAELDKEAAEREARNKANNK